MKYAQFDPLVRAVTREALMRSICDIACELEFDRASLLLAVDVANAPTVFDWVSNAPASFADRALDPASGRRDPVMQAIKSQHMPVIYEQSTYVRAEAGDLWEEQASFGYCTGVAVALHLADGKHVAVGFNRRQRLPDGEPSRMVLLGQMLLVAAAAIEPAQRCLSAPASPTPVSARLSARERDILAWTLEGKSSWAVGQILGISTSTVNFHLRQATKKLHASSKFVAAFRAQSLGLLG
jgi:DNA-binding CsgD family transcriptional regulator